MKQLNSLLFVLTVFAMHASAQTASGTIKGTVTTSDNKPAEGVTIYLQDINKAVIADNNGAFTIQHVPPGTHILVVSLVSHQDVEQPVTVDAGKTADVTIKLSLSNKELTEVVVIGNKSSFKSNRMSASLRLQTS